MELAYHQVHGVSTVLCCVSVLSDHMLCLQSIQPDQQRNQKMKMVTSLAHMNVDVNSLWVQEGSQSRLAFNGWART